MHLATVKSGDINELKTSDEFSDFCWVTSEEVKELIENDYWKAVRPVLHEY